MATIQLDIAYDCDHSSWTQDQANRHGLKVTLVKLIGPAGGNPLYEFEGPREGLLALLRDYVGDQVKDFDYLASHIED